MACEPQERVGTFSREAVNVFSRSAIVPAGLVCTGQGLACARDGNMREVDAATFTNNVVMESMVFVFFPKICSDILYTYIPGT